MNERVSRFGRFAQPEAPGVGWGRCVWFLILVALIAPAFVGGLLGVIVGLFNDGASPAEIVREQLGGLVFLFFLGAGLGIFLGFVPSLIAGIIVIVQARLSRPVTRRMFVVFAVVSAAAAVIGTGFISSSGVDEGIWVLAVAVALGASLVASIVSLLRNRLGIAGFFAS